MYEFVNPRITGGGDHNDRMFSIHCRVSGITLADATTSTRQQLQQQQQLHRWIYEDGSGQQLGGSIRNINFEVFVVSPHVECI